MFFFVFMQKPAYELRISDWSSDVCSSDRRGPASLDAIPRRRRLSCFANATITGTRAKAGRSWHFRGLPDGRRARPIGRTGGGPGLGWSIGRASCRDRGGLEGYEAGGAVYTKNKTVNR